MAFMGEWPVWAIYAAIGALFGLAGGLLSFPLAKRNKKLSAFVVIAAIAMSRPVTEQFVLPKVANDYANKDLPKKLDNVTTMTKVTISGSTIVYNYDIDPSVALVSGPEMMKLIGPDACQYWKPKFASGDATSAEYVYKFASGQSRFTLTKQSCG